jgi:hypothetical protein
VKLVERTELLDWVTWSERRDAQLGRVMAAKALRRVHIGDYLTLLFENADTIRYQIQEMMRVERMAREADIRHELDTYNELIGQGGELGCTLLVEIEDAGERDEKLRRWRDLPARVYARLANGERVAARPDPRQIAEERLSSVQYVKFPTGGEVPVAVGTDLPELAAETELSSAQRAALQQDLST